MKRLAFFLFIGSILSSCNDGDLVFEDLNFSGNVQECTDKNIYYKLNGNEMLFTYVPNVSLRDLEVDEVRIHKISNSNELVYRQYSDKTTANLICNVIAPATPSVVEEFNVNTGGEIIYKRIRRITQTESSSSVKIEYIYTFNFKNVILSNGSKEIKYENYNFGELLDSSINLNLQSIQTFSFCSDSNSEIVAINDSSHAIKINSDELAFPEIEGVKTINLNNANFIEYLVFGGNAIDKIFVCDYENNLNQFLYLKEKWEAKQGTLEIVTTANYNTENSNIIGYTHTLILKNATFTEGPSSFVISEQTLGIYSTTNNN